MSQSSANPDDQPFQHYTAKHRAIAWISRSLFDDVTYTVRRGLLKGMKRKGGLAWLPGPDAVTAEEVFWARQDFRGMTVYDVGAFHGLLTLFFARQARQVVCYEPNSRNHARLSENLALNGISNVRIRKVGVGSRPGTLTMVTNPDMPGGASAEDNLVQGIRRSGQKILQEQISIVTLDSDIREHSLPPPDFIKIDIEGSELPALNGARETLAAHKPHLFLEMHGETMNLKRKKVTEIVTFLEEAGYGDIIHIESGSRIHRQTAAVAAQGHLFCKPGR